MEKKQKFRSWDHVSHRHLCNLISYLISSSNITKTPPSQASVSPRTSNCPSSVTPFCPAPPTTPTGCKALFCISLNAFLPGSFFPPISLLKDALGAFSSNPPSVIFLPRGTVGPAMLLLFARYDDDGGGAVPLLLPNTPLAALNWASSFQSSNACRASASGAAGRVVAPDVSVLFVVVEAEGCCEAAAWLPPNDPPDRKDSAARESEVMVPGFSILGSEVVWGSVVTCRGLD
jgi:hypothetical protein